jgi:hypothetical protein
MTDFTGLPRPAVAFDCDGVLTSQGTTVIGTDQGADWDVAPIRLALDRGCAVSVMTCNVPSWVADQLRNEGLSVLADDAMAYKAWDGGPDGKTVLITGRKVLADLYVDDHALGWTFGQDAGQIFTRLAQLTRPQITDAEAGELLTMLVSGDPDDNSVAEAVVDLVRFRHGITDESNSWLVAGA